MFSFETFEELEVIEPIHAKELSKLLKSEINSYEAIEDELGLVIERGNKKVLELLAKLKKEDPELFEDYYVVKYPLTFSDILKDLEFSMADFDAACDDEDEDE